MYILQRNHSIHISLEIDYAVFQWIRENTLDRLSIDLSDHRTKPGTLPIATGAGVWKDRKEAEGSLKAYLSEYPCVYPFLTT